MTTKDLKQAIKDLSQKQRETKTQRKSGLPIGTPRTMHPKDAQLLALKQKEELKHRFIAYAILRGKSIETAIGPKLDANGNLRDAHTTYSKRRVDEIKEKYGEAVCVSAN